MNQLIKFLAKTMHIDWSELESTLAFFLNVGFPPGYELQFDILGVSSKILVKVAKPLERSKTQPTKNSFL